MTISLVREAVLILAEPELSFCGQLVNQITRIPLGRRGERRAKDVPAALIVQDKSFAPIEGEE